MKEKFCQSCGMPLCEEVYGTNKDGSKNEEFCSYCYQNGSYTYDCTMDEMIDICIEPMHKEMSNRSIEDIRNELKAYMPTLKRWQS